jgi:cell division transport system permease protein
MLFLLFGLLFVSITMTAFTNELIDRIDISVYFINDAPEERILKIADSLRGLNDIKSVQYISKEEALTKFKERYGDKETIMMALDELGANPLQPTLNIKTHNVASYQLIADYLARADFQDIVENVNYTQNKDIIDKVQSVTDAIKRAVFILMLVVGVNAILVAFNTIRVAIYSSKEEISVMRLVGASNWFVRGPFILSGALYGLCAAALTIIVSYGVILYISPSVVRFEPSLDILAYFHANFLKLSVILVGTGVGLGIASSFIAMRRYLKI